MNNKKENDILKMLEMNYDECCNFLKSKYGIIEKSYFCNETCRSANKSIKRTGDGLFIHHIDEDKAIMLSTKSYALQNPFEYQKGDRLVYCNLLEHLILHIKIVEFPNPNKKDIYPGVGGIVNFIIPELNDIYSGIKYDQKWRERYVQEIIELRDSYLKCIDYLTKKFVVTKDNLLTSNPKSVFIWNKKNNKEIFDEIKSIWKNNEEISRHTKIENDVLNGKYMEDFSIDDFKNKLIQVIENLITCCYFCNTKLGISIEEIREKQLCSNLNVDYDPITHSTNRRETVCINCEEILKCRICKTRLINIKDKSRYKLKKDGVDIAYLVALGLYDFLHSFDKEKNKSKRTLKKWKSFCDLISSSFEKNVSEITISDIKKSVCRSCLYSWIFDFSDCDWNSLKEKYKSILKDN